MFDSQVAGSVSPAAYAPTSPAWSAIDADAAVAPPQNQLVAVASEAELQLVAVASSKLPGPRKRTSREHQLVAQKMVTGKLRKRMLRAEAGRAEAGGAQIEEQDARLDAQLRAAYPAQLSSVTTRALELAMSRSGLRDTACKVALTQMQLQANALLDVLEQVVEGKLRLRLFWEKYKWDETLERLSLSGGALDDEDWGDLLPNQMKSTWNVLVQKRWIGWVTVEGKVFEVPLVVPPVILAGSITAGCLWSAMFGEGKYAKSLQEVSEKNTCPNHEAPTALHGSTYRAHREHRAQGIDHRAQSNADMPIAQYICKQAGGTVCDDMFGKTDSGYQVQCKKIGWLVGLASFTKLPIARLVNQPDWTLQRK